MKKIIVSSAVIVILQVIYYSWSYQKLTDEKSVFENEKVIFDDAMNMLNKEKSKFEEEQKLFYEARNQFNKYQSVVKDIAIVNAEFEQNKNRFIYSYNEIPNGSEGYSIAIYKDESEIELIEYNIPTTIQSTNIRVYFIDSNYFYIRKVESIYDRPFYDEGFKVIKVIESEYIISEDDEYFLDNENSVLVKSYEDFNTLIKDFLNN